jgi:hypothetical protein
MHNRIYCGLELSVSVSLTDRIQAEEPVRARKAADVRGPYAIEVLSHRVCMPHLDEARSAGSNQIPRN